jgi:tetratricopeptide (TPR) repeat protein
MIRFFEKQLTHLKIKKSLLLGNYDRANLQINAALKRHVDDIKTLTLAQEVFDRSRDWVSFFSIYEQLEKFYTNKVQFNLNYGTSLLSAFQYKNAIPKFRYVVTNWNLDSSYFRNLANTYARLAICYGHLREWVLFNEALHDGMKIARWDPDVAYAQLLKHYGAGKPNEIENYLDDQIDKYPRLHALYYWKALYISNYLHDAGEAARWYEKALKRLNWFETKKSYWRIFFSVGRYASPLSILKRSVDAYALMGESSNALRLMYDTKLRLLDSDIDIQTMLIYLDIKIKAYGVAEKKCLRLLDKKLSIDKAAECWYLLALAQVGLEKLDDSLFSIKKALSIDSLLYDAQELLALIYLQKGDWELALQMFYVLLDINCFNSNNWSNLGLCFTKIGNLPSAISSYEQAVYYNPFDANSWVNLANLYYNLDNKDLALSAYKNGLKYEWLSTENRKHAHEKIQQLGTTQ